MKTNVIEGNKLIAEFMEISISENRLVCDFPHGFILRTNAFLSFLEDIEDVQILEHLEFHSSWDWLMGVVKKLQEVTEEPEELDNLKDVLWWGNIENVFREVVDYIKIYNENK